MKNKQFTKGSYVYPLPGVPKIFYVAEVNEKGIYVQSLATHKRLFCPNETLQGPRSFLPVDMDDPYVQLKISLFEIGFK